MSKETGGVVIVFAGFAVAVLTFRGVWGKTWAALMGHAGAGTSAGTQSSAELASFYPASSTGRPGAPTRPAVPLSPAGGGYGALVRGPRFARVDQGIDFTGPGEILAPIAGVVRRVQRSGSGWPGEGAFELLQLENGRDMYVAEDFQPTVVTGEHVGVGELIGRATGSGRAPGIEIGWADPQGHALAPLHPNPDAPKAAGLDFQHWILGR